MTRRNGKGRENYPGIYRSAGSLQCSRLIGKSAGTRFFFHKNNEAQICPKINNKLKTFEARLQMQMYLKLQFFKIKKQHITSFWRFNAEISAVRNTETLTTRIRFHLKM